MFKLRKFRADSHFAIIDLNGPWEFLKPGSVITYNDEFYVIKNVIIPLYDSVKGAQVAKTPEQIEAIIPTLIVESFPLI